MAIKSKLLKKAGGSPDPLIKTKLKGKNMLYKLDFTVEYDETMAQQGLLGIWAEEANAALGAKSAGLVVDLWKVVGERKVLAILEVETPDDLDRILFDLPIMQKMGHLVQVEVKSLRRYEDFAEDVKERLGR
jgi:muconolactone delta-isomerase